MHLHQVQLIHCMWSPLLWVEHYDFNTFLTLKVKKKIHVKAEHDAADSNRINIPPTLNLYHLIFLILCHHPPFKEAMQSDVLSAWDTEGTLISVCSASSYVFLYFFLHTHLFAVATALLSFWFVLTLIHVPVCLHRWSSRSWCHHWVQMDEILQRWILMCRLDRTRMHGNTREI